MKKSLTPNRPIVESGWREQPLVFRDSWWIWDLRKSHRKTARLGLLPGMIVDVVLWNELMKNHCWKGTVLRRAESVQNSIYVHKILYIVE